MVDLIREAAVLREAFLLGAVSQAEIVEWADEYIRSNERSPIELIELSMMTRSHPLDVLRGLTDISSSIPVVDVLPAAMGIAYKKLLLDVSYCRSLADGLWDAYVRCNYEVPEFLRMISWFSDAFSLSDSSIFNEEEIEKDLIEFLKNFVAS